jgi:hypothetical protein
MAITCSLLASGAPNPGTTTAVTASVSASGSDVLFLCFDQYFGASGSVTSISGLGGTWSAVRSVNPWTANIAMYVWQGIGCTGSGTITVTFGQDAFGMRYHVIGVAGCNSTTPVVQSNGASGTGTGSGFITPAVSLASFGSASNGVLCFGICGDSGGTPAVGSGYTSLGSTQDGSWGSIDLLTQWRADNDTTPDCTMGQNASTDPWGFIALEIAQATAGGGIPRAAMYYNRRD